MGRDENHHVNSTKTESWRFHEFWLLVRFVFVGGLNSGLHALIVLLVSIGGPRLPGFAIILIAWFVSIPFGYASQAKLVWHARLTWRGLARLTASQLPSIATSTILSGIAGAIGLSLFWQEAIALVSGTILSYILQRLWVFGDREGRKIVVREEV